MDRPLDETASREARIGRALDELGARRARGEQVSDAAFLQSHADIADALQPMLTLLHELHGVRPADQHRAFADLLPDGDSQSRAARRLGVFRIDGVLGRGGMGFVLDAFDERLARRVALKVLKPEWCETPSAVARFHREARVAASLNHPNIVAIYDVGCERGLPFIAMERVAGPTLALLIDAAGPLPPELIRIIVSQLLGALGAAHHAGLIHRDVKPSNILVHPGLGPRPGDRDSRNAEAPEPDDVGQTAALLADPAAWPRVRAKLADFGLARMRSPHTQVTTDGSAIGTPEYMSPEQARGDAEIDARTDLYSVGVVLYELLTGKTPFRASTMTGTLRLILETEPIDPCSVNPAADRALASLTMRLLSKQPQARLSSAAEAADALQSHRRVKPSTATRRARTRWKKTAFATATVVLVALSFTRFFPRSTATPQGPRLTEVKLHQADGQPLEILATFDYSAAPRQLYTFPSTVTRAEAKPQLVNIDGNRNQIVVVGVDGAPGGDSIFGFSPAGAPVWSTNLAPKDPVQWPDASDETYWTCRQILIADVDNEPGDEVVVLARQRAEYPCCIAIIDPRDGAVRTQFWHTGHLQSLAIVSDYFAGGRPALAAWGQNNKLDGWSPRLNQQSRGDPPRTRHDVVTVFAILDPLDMSGLGPPRTSLIALPQTAPVAYAFVDLEMLSDSPFSITEFLPQLAPPHSDGKDPRLCFSIECGEGGSGTLVLDRRLEVDEVIPVAGSHRMTREFWGAHWRLVTQDRQYVDQPTADTSP